MGGLNPKSLSWLDQMDTLKGNPNASRIELQKMLDLGNSQISNLRTLGDCFDPTAAEKVRQAAIAKPPFILSSKSALALSGLNGKVADLPASLHAALDVALARQLATGEIKSLVKWIIQGNSPESFKESAVPQKGSSSRLVESRQIDDLDQLAQLVEWARAEKAQDDGKTTAQDKLKAHLGKLSLSPTAKAVGDTSGTSPDRNKKSKKGSGNPSLLLEWAAGISIYSQIKSKIKKGQSLSLSDIGLLALHVIGKLLHWLRKDLLKWIGHGIKSVFKILIESLKILGIYNFVRAVVVLALFALILWKAWDMRQYGFWHPINLVRYKFFSSPQNTGTSSSTQHADVPTPVVVASSDKHEIKKHPQSPRGISSTPIMALDVAWTQQTLAGIPPNSVIKPYVFEPDFAMGSDMAYHLIMDLQGSEKYTVYWGGDKVQVTNIITGASQITLTLQNGLIPLLGSSKFDFYWADLKIFHVNLIEFVDPKIANGNNGPMAQPNLATHLVGSRHVYQCTLVLAESKKPLTLQCNNPVDMERLVSALEFYIKLSGTNAVPINGLPYLNQGVRLDKEGKIITLWAGSPMDKARMVLGDFLWSVGTKTDHQQSQSEMETGLQNLRPGTNPFYYVTARGWKLALQVSGPNEPDYFRPLRRKANLKVP